MDHFIFKCTVWLFTALFLFSCTKKQVWNVSEFGAVGDGKTIDTEAIQNAIDACNRAGGGTVLLKDGTFVTGTILLKSNVNLRIEKGAVLLSSKNPNDFEPIDPFIDATGQYRGQCLIGAMNVENVTISGGGIIDGRGEFFTHAAIKKTLEELGEEENKQDYEHLISDNIRYVNKNIRYGNRPFLIRLVRVKNCTVKDVLLRQPAAWTLHFFRCENFVVDGIEIFSHANRNNDGIDIDSSKGGVIRNCHINSGDDAICVKATGIDPTENIEVYNCRLSSHWGAIKFGTESLGDFRNITIRNCTIYDNKGGGIKILSVDGSNIENIVIDSIRMENVDMPIFVRLGERLLAYRDAESRPVGSIKDVRISNVQAKARSLADSRIVPPCGIFITGTPEHKIESISLKNIHIILPGGGKPEDAKKVVPENEQKYPEYTMFDGCLPAYGLFARHIQSLETVNVQFELLASDARPERVFANVEQVR